MKSLLFVLGLCAVAAAQHGGKPAPPAPPAPAPAAKVAPAEAGKPKTKSETLNFTVNWPSGLSLGEGQLTSTQTSEGWKYSMKVEAAIPAFSVAEEAESKATADYCAIELEKTGTRGKREVTEVTKFDSSNLTATRETRKGGGKSEMRINSCAKDALTYLQFLRRELVAGRLPQAQQVYYGAGYQTRVQYVGTVKTASGDADKLTAHIKGPASEFSVDLLFARDESRTPISAQIPVAVGKFTVEFSR